VLAGGVDVEPDAATVGAAISCLSRSTEMTALAPRSASSISLSISLCGS